MDFNRQNIFQATSAKTAVWDAGLRAYMLKVYNYMATGVLLTGIISLISFKMSVVTDSAGTIASFTSFGNAIFFSGLKWVIMLAPLAIVFYMSFGINKMSAAKAQTVFWIFASLMGLSLSWILLVYTGVSVARVFFITSATFGAMSIYGYTTKRDLTKFGSFLMMGLIGIIIASLVNIFMKSSMMYFVISIIGVLVFVGLTAYDTQKIKNMYLVSDSGELMGKKATALIAAEAGGINGTLPFIVSAYTGLPVIDADGMGRAFPELQMCTFGVYGVNCSPVIVRDEKDNEMVVDAENNHASEMFARVICMQMGTKSEICLVVDNDKKN